MTTSIPSVVWGSPHWLTAALVLLGVATATIWVTYARARTNRSVKILAATLKTLGFTALALSLLDPLLTGRRPLRGANTFVILADNSQSMHIKGDGMSATRGDWLRGILSPESAWKTRLGQEFDVRKYVFDTHLRGCDNFEQLSFEGTGTALVASLGALSKRFRGLPLAGVLLFSDGNKTDRGDLDVSGLPPIYPVAPPSKGVSRDVGVSRISISQTNFESAPTVLSADVVTYGYQGKPVVAVVADLAGKKVERQQAVAGPDGELLSFRFQFRPERRGVNCYQVRAFAASEEPPPGSEPAAALAQTAEQTLANNSRLVVIDQGGGPYRVLYVSGRPDWEFKFLRRALEEDDQLELAGLVRIARRQPKFDFQNQRSRSASPLFDGFDHPDAETAERSDQPVLIRLGKKLDGVELRDGFPKTADELYRYHAIVLDDIEAGFFTPDQLALIRNFVSQRGGGLLMLGGPDSFASGKYDRTPVGELLPVYMNRSDPSQDEQEYRLVLTREGWLQPWVRLRKNEDEERQRIAGMVSFDSLSRVGEIKPGAVVLAEVTNGGGTTRPALVAQQFGKGHVGALLMGRLWRWGMHRENVTDSDLDRSWRQTVRWLVSDVPARVEVSVSAKPDSAVPAVELVVRVRDAEYRPLDNAKVALKVTVPGGDGLTVDAEPDPREAGLYSTTYVPKQQGAYQVLATVTGPDGSSVGDREAGWTAQPAADEFARLEPDRDFLKTIASRTHGEIADADNLDAFVAGLSSRTAPITEPWTSPLWHTPLYFLIAIVCLASEWGVRRLNGLA